MNTNHDALREAAEKVCLAWEADPTDPTAFGSAMDKSVADLQLSLSQPPAPEQIVCGGPGCDGECCQKEQAAEPAAPVAAKPEQQAQAREPEVWDVWIDGEPPFPQKEEWFIAETIYGDRVVLRALEKGTSYDYTTADKTYMMANNIKRWMQFPDGEYISVAAKAIAKKDAALKACVEALERVEPHSGYGFFRPENPHDFFPDPESCTADEIANHKAACDAYDAGTYTPDNSDGWITPDLHITKAPWGIGSYTARDPAIVAAITQAKEALK